MADATEEQKALRRSIAMTVFVGATGIGFGLLSGSQSIVFDGLFSGVDAAMTFVALLVAKLITRENSERFQLGFWHIEPIVLAVNASLLTLLSAYAFVNAIGTLMAGGRLLSFDWAIVYAVVVLVCCAVMYLTGRRANRSIGSEFLALDTKGWLMSGTITAALLVAFTVAWFLQGTRHEWMTPYVDPAILAVLTLAILPVPVRTIMAAVSEIFLVAPRDLDRKAQDAARTVVERHGLTSYRTYVAKVGRSKLYEIHLVFPAGYEVGAVERLDGIRQEISDELGDAGPDRWLTVTFTADERWAI